MCTVTTVNLRWFWFTLTCHLRQVLVGVNIRPPQHMFPKAPWPERWVPLPPTRGICATAWPVPQDSALVWWLTFSLTAYACCLFFAMLLWTCWTTFSLMGAVKNGGTGKGWGSLARSGTDIDCGSWGHKYLDVVVVIVGLFPLLVTLSCHLNIVSSVVSSLSLAPSIPPYEQRLIAVAMGAPCCCWFIVEHPPSTLWAEACNGGGGEVRGRRSLGLVVIWCDVMFIVDVQHSSCDVLRVGWNDLKVNNYNTDENPPFLGWKKLLKFVILKCEIYPLKVLTEKKTYLPMEGNLLFKI
jgi:hypothetical protein